ncbi:MAG: L-threonylcarbamoyladenylate synthase [Desulfobacterales bacterium]
MKITPKIRSIDPRRPRADLIDAAVRILENGGVIAFPTGSLYGLGADALNTGAVKRVFTIKRRPPDKPLLILVSDRDVVFDLAAEVTPAAKRLMDRFWPGRVTIVFRALSILPANLTAGSGKIGIRLPGHPVAKALVAALGRPITGTSANPSGHKGCHRIAELDPKLIEQLDLVLDAGQLKEGIGSTVIDITGAGPIVIREGVVSKRAILAAVC